MRGKRVNGSMKLNNIVIIVVLHTIFSLFETNAQQSFFSASGLPAFQFFTGNSMFSANFPTKYGRYEADYISYQSLFLSGTQSLFLKRTDSIKHKVAVGYGLGLWTSPLKSFAVAPVYSVMYVLKIRKWWQIHTDLYGSFFLDGMYHQARISPFVFCYKRFSAGPEILFDIANLYTFKEITLAFSPAMKITYSYQFRKTGLR